VKLTRAELLGHGVSWQALLGMWAATNEPGATRAARKRRTLPKTARFAIGIPVKFADRIANLEECVRRGNVAQFDKYEHEEPLLEKYLRRRNDPALERMVSHLHWLFENGKQLMEAFARDERVVGIPA